MDNTLKHSQIILLLVLRKDSSSRRIATASALATVHTRSTLRNSNWIQKIRSQYFDKFLCFDLVEKCQFWTISVPVGGWNTKWTDFNVLQERFPSNKCLSVHSCFTSVSATCFLQLCCLVHLHVFFFLSQGTIYTITSFVPLLSEESTHWKTISPLVLVLQWPMSFLCALNSALIFQ